MNRPIRPQLRVPLEATEEQFQAIVLRWAMLQGWRRHHVRPAQTGKGWRSPVSGDAGFPDLVLARDGSIVFAELKTEKTGAAAEQRDWLSALSGYVPEDGWASRGEEPTGRAQTTIGAAGETIHVVQLWRPRHWPYIEELLRKAVRR